VSTRLNKAIDKYFTVKVGRESIYIWKSRRFEEMMYMHLPRLIFISFSVYVIYRINLKQYENKKWKNSVTSFRQEEINKQLEVIYSLIL